jgi:hypothetical protein
VRISYLTHDQLSKLDRHQLLDVLTNLIEEYQLLEKTLQAVSSVPNDSPSWRKLRKNLAEEMLNQDLNLAQDAEKV